MSSTGIDPARADSGPFVGLGANLGAGLNADLSRGLNAGCARSLDTCQSHVDVGWQFGGHGLLLRYHLGRAIMAMRPMQPDAEPSGRGAIRLWYRHRWLRVAGSAWTLSAHNLLGLGHSFEPARPGRLPLEPALEWALELDLSGRGRAAGLSLVLGLSARASPTGSWADIVKARDLRHAFAVEVRPTLSLRIAPITLIRGTH